MQPIWRRPLQLSQLGALYWLCTSSPPFASCGLERPSERPGAPPAEGDELKLVQVIFRHGARTPLTDKFWPDAGVKFEKGAICGELLPQKVDIAITNGADGGPQPFARHDARQAAKVLPGGCTKGELTLVGQQQALDLGAWLRRRYVDQLGFLPAQSAAGSMAGRTTNYRRTIGTLEYVVSGLYQSADAAIPVATATEMEEILFGNAKSCEQLGVLMSTQRKALKESRQRSQEVKHLEARVYQAMGTSPESGHVSFVELHDALTTLRFHDKPLPGRFDAALLEGIEKEAAVRMLAMIAPADGDAGADAGLLRLGVGRLAHEIVQRMDASIKGESGHQLFLYSGHDTTVMPLLRALGLPVERWPGYVSNLVFELWDRPSADGSAPPQHIVRVLYQGEVLAFPGTDVDGTISLADMHKGAFGGQVLDAAKHADLCKVKLDHDDKSPRISEESGDAVQGL